MHRGFKIPEILQLIFDEFSVEPIPRVYYSPPVNPPILAALARTCQLFHSPALDLLWRRQETLLNFLNCFPDGLIEKVTDGVKRPALLNFRLLRPISDEDFDRPRLYTLRVQQLILRDELHLTSWNEVLTPYIGAHMFPNLKSLQYAPYKPPSFENLHLLLSPSIVKIHLDFRTESTALSQIIPTLTQHCPLLADITLFTVDMDSLHVISAFVRSLVCIERLSVNNLTRTAFEHLGRVSTLKSLNITHLEVPRGISTLSMTGSITPFPMYSSLESLYFSSQCTLKHISAFINLIAHCPLRTLDIGGLDSVTRGDAGLFYTVLAAHFSHQSLRKIETGTYSSQMSDEPNTTLYTINAATLQILFCFANLVNVCFAPPFAFDLDDADVLEMASAWPRIQNLQIKCSRVLRPRITLKGLTSLAHRCPHLLRLEMDFDATSVPEVAGAGATNISQSSLRTIVVAIFPITTPGPVAAFISRVFPKAEIVCSPFGLSLDPGSEEVALYARRWKEVNRILGGEWDDSDSEGVVLEDDGDVDGGVWEDASNAEGGVLEDDRDMEDDER
ncbi:hypothetical protein DFH09DRAFT_1030272 [Mycena vulgaris]|nr:hypothetical protein DFH09DRAFT_1030272 [Mycena vulgaris]